MLSNSDKSEFLRGAELFTELPDDVLSKITEISQEQHYKVNHVLFKEGDLADSLYMILEGEVEIVKEGIAVLTHSKPHTCIGEMSIIEENTFRSVMIRCTKYTKMLKILRQDFLDILRKEATMVEGIFRVLIAKLRNELETRVTDARKEIALQESIRMARTIQQSLLPNNEIDTPHIVTASHCQPAGSIGGDYYDYIPLDESRMGVFMADAVGHGLHSAMLGAMAKSCLHTQIVFDSSINSIMQSMDRIVEKSVRDTQTRDFQLLNMYMSCCYIIIDTENEKFEFINAGHPSMLLYRSATEEIVELKSQFPPLGLLPVSNDIEYNGKEARWQRNDVLVLYSDGITEQENPMKAEYGQEKLKQMILKSADASPAEIKQKILSDFETHLDGKPVEDDVTIIVIKAI